MVLLVIVWFQSALVDLQTISVILSTLAGTIITRREFTDPQHTPERYYSPVRDLQTEDSQDNKGIKVNRDAQHICQQWL